jgi:hypothetical protein
MSAAVWRALNETKQVRPTLLAIVLLITAPCSAAERAPLHRAIVPADRSAAWPAGDWQRVPSSDLFQFERDYRDDAIVDVAPPIVDRLVFRGSLTDRTVLEGTFEAEARRFDPRAAFLELGLVTPAISAIQWSDRPTVWGSAPDGTVLLSVDRDADVFSGQWSQRGEEVLGGSEFDLRVFPAASIRVELTLPAAYELQASRGVVLPPESQSADTQVWAIELGQQTACLITVVPKSDRPPIVSMSVERSAAWSIRPDGCRLQTDFNISIPASSPATLEFEIPDDLQNPEVTTTSNISLPAEVDRRSMPPRLIVPLPRLAAGRLGIIRVSGDVALRTDEDWTLPDVRLENSTVVSSIRRMHVDRPLKLQSLDLDGVRQTDINMDDSGRDWTFEDTAPEARVVVRIGRPASLLSLGAVTLIELSQSEARFRAAVEVLSRGGGDYRAELRLPAGWNVIEVGSPSGDRGAVTSWRTTDTDTGVRLEIEFRQSLSSQSPRRVVISGRRIGALVSTGEIELFPTLSTPEEARVWLGVRHDGPSTGSLTPRDGARAFDTSETAPEWSRLVAALGVADSDKQWSWFTQPDSQATGAIAWGTATTQDSSNPAPPDAKTPAISPTPAVGKFALDLLLETDTGGPDAPWVRHRAQYALSGRRPDDPPKIQMPAGAQIDGLAVDGQPQNVITAGETIELLEWPATSRIIEIRYRTRNTGSPHWLSRPLEVPLPSWDVSPQSLEWRLHVPRTERLADIRIPCSAVLPRPDFGWMSRLFGPLGRDNWQLTANPFSVQSWQQRLWPREQPSDMSSGIVTIFTPIPGNTLSVELANLRNVDRAGWLSILGTVLLAGLLRLWSRRGAPLLWLGACLLLVGVSLLPYVAATLCGGALSGVLIGALLPRQWMTPARRASATPARPSALTRTGAAVGAVLLMLNVWQGQLRAQPTPPQKSDQGATAAVRSAPVEFDLLVPETAGVPDEFALIQRRLLPLFEQWQRSRHRNPAYLVQSARYALELAETPQVHARYTVAVFDQRPFVPLVLPFGRLSVTDPDACRVNGESAQIRPSTSSSAILIELPGADLDESTPVRMADVELTLQLSAASKAGTGWEFDVPPVLDAEVSLPVASVDQDLTVASEVEHIETDGRHVFEIGGRSTVAIRTATSTISSSAESLTADAVTLIEVHPLRLRVRTNLLLAPTPRSGLPSRPQRLRLVLPEQSDVREVAVGGLRSYAVRHPQRDITLVELELDRWPSPDTGIHLDFTLPVRRSAEGIVIPPIPLLRDNRVLSHHIGLRAGPGMMLEPSPTSRLPASLHEMPAEMFSSGRSTDTAWPIPSLVYVATAPASLTVDSRPIQSKKSVTLEQSIVIGEDALHWQATADIEISLIPAYQYEFELSTAVELAAVSLVDEGVERLLDWSHIGDRLLLYLPGDHIGKQKVRLTGTMRFDRNVITSFPAFKMRDAQMTSSELLIQAAPSRRFELFAADGSPLPPVAGSVAAGTMQFTQQDAELPSAFRALPAADPLSISVVTTFDHAETGWKLLTRIIPTRALGNDESIQISLPQELARLATAVVPAIINRVDAGTIYLTSQSGAPSSTVVPLAFRLPVEVPDRGEWTAPHPNFPNATVTDEFAVIPAEFPLTPATGASALVDPAAWPADLLERPGQPENPSIAAVYRWTGDNAIFQGRSHADGAPDVQLIESIVWHDGSGTSGGETSVWLIARQSRCDASFDWPADVELRSAIWDGRPIEPSPQRDAELEFRIAGLSPGSLHCLTLTWNDSRGASGATGELWRPRGSREITAQEFATILPRDGYILLPQYGQPARSEILKLRAETLLNLAATAGSTSGPESTTALSLEIDAALGALEQLSPSDARVLRARQAALPRPTDQNAAVPADPIRDDDAPAPNLMAVAWRDPAALPVRLSDRNPEVRFWELHTGLTAAAACLAGLLLLTLCLRFRSAVLRAAGRLPFDPAALRVLALGSLWWTWLKFGAVGLLLMLASAVVQRQARNRAPSDAPTSPA